MPEDDRNLLISEARHEEVDVFMPEQEVLLPELPPSPWRSLGKRLDYRTWEDRERFVELDAAISLRQEIWEPRRRPIQENNQKRLSGQAGSLLSAA